MRLIVQIVLTFVVNALWQGMLIVACAALGDWLLRLVNPRYRHCLWVIALFAFLIIPALSCWPLMQRPAVAASATPLGPIPLVTSRITTPGVEDVSTRQLLPEPEIFPRPAGSRSIRVAQWLALVIASIYLLIVLWRAVALLRAWRRTKKIIGAAFACTFPDSVQLLIERCQAEAGVTSCRVLCSADVALPITVGVIDRIVILPQRFMREINVELLTSALGHELQHVARHDYLLNLIYEVIYLPLSFHPAAAFARRRIRHTRELCCDAAVTAGSISAEAYARSLVRLVGSAPLLPLAPDTTIGLNESDILEVRIMALLKKSHVSWRRRTLLLVAAVVLFLTPCIGAAQFALTVSTQDPAQAGARQKLEASQDVAQKQKALIELERQASELKEKLAQAPVSMRPEMEKRLREVEQNLVEHQRSLEESQRNLDTDRMKAMLARQSDQASADAIKFELMRKFEAEAAAQGDRKARVLSHSEARYTDDARAQGIEGKVVLRFTVDHDGIPQNIEVKKSLYPSLDQASIEAVRTWRFEPAMKNGQVVSMVLETEMNFSLYQEPRKVELQPFMRSDKEELDRNLTQELKVRAGNEAGRRAEREAEEKRNAILAAAASISMDHAIQIATSKAPGKVIECSLVGEHWEGPAELAKPSLVLYHVVVLSGDATPVRTHVLVNAVDGSVVKVSQEEKREEELTGWALYPTRNEARTEARAEAKIRTIEGGVLNGKATSMPAPSYPVVARDAHAAGSVSVRVVVDGDGNVIEATPVTGHPLLRSAALAAAREAKFAPTRLQGEPVAVTGVLVYNFVAQ